MKHPEWEPRPPEDFSKYLATRTPVLIVGGQAVNLWGLYYHEVTSDLAPFVSRDVDVYGRRETLREIAALAGLKPQFFPLRPPSNEVGFIQPMDDSKVPLFIEVLRSVNGVNEEELNKNSVMFQVGEQGVSVRVPSPLTLLKAKLSNVDQINQEGRQDVKHVTILFRVLPLYLHDVGQSVVSGRRKEREFVSILDDLLVVLTKKHANRIFKECGLQPKSLFSMLEHSELPKVSSFIKHQLPRRLGL